MNDVEIKQNLQRAFGGKLISEIQEQKNTTKKPSKKASKKAPKTPKKTAKKTK